MFFDIDNIRPGRDFIKIVSEQVSACEVLLAVLGRGWLTALDDQNRRRIDDPKDLVRIEIETALNRGIIVIPVFVDGATMPRQDKLPGTLMALASRQGLEVSHSRFDSDVMRLIHELRSIVDLGAAPGVRSTTNPKT